MSRIHYFSHWTNSFTDTVTPLDFTVAQTNAAITPVFLPLPPGEFALSVEVSGYGRVRGQPSRLLNRYSAGSNVVLRALPDAGQVFEGWTFKADGLNPAAFLTNNPATVLMNTNRSLTAQFSRSPRIEIVQCQGELVTGLFRMKVHGKLLNTYAIEAAPAVDNPAAWREVARATNMLGAVQYEDPYLPEVKQRFYRARWVP